MSKEINLIDIAKLQKLYIDIFEEELEEEEEE